MRVRGPANVQYIDKDLDGVKVKVSIILSKSIQFDTL